MQTYEVQPYIKNIYLVNKDSWEQTRLNAFVTALVNSSKKLKVTDIIQFPWEDTNIKSGGSISNEDVERLKLKAKQYLNNGKI